MFLLILDKNPYKAAELVPDRLKFKQLLELCQLICSAGISDVFKPIKQGKELQKWILKNKYWVWGYFEQFFLWVQNNVNLKKETYLKFRNIEKDFFNNLNENQTPTTTAIFRYVKEYTEFTEYESNSELSIDVAVNEYKKYVEWKEKQFNSKRK